MTAPNAQRLLSRARLYIPESLFVAAFAISYALSEIPLVTPDSGGYIRRGEAIFVADQPEQAETWGSISLLGDSFRAWPTTLFYSIVPAGDAPFGNTGRIFIQSVLVIVVTIWLAHRLSDFVPRSRRWIVRVAVYLLMLTPTALTYSFMVGAEGPTTILVFATAAATLELPRRITADAPWPVVAAWAGGGWLLGLLGVLARPSALPILLVVLGVGGYLLVTRRVSPGWKPQLAATGAVVLLALASVSYASVNQDNQSQAWGDVTERTYRIFFALDVQSNERFMGEFRESIPADAPDCLERYPGDRALGWTEMGEFALNECGPDGVSWIQDNYFQTMVGYYAGDPRNTVAYFTRTAAGAAGPSAAPQVTSVSVPVVDSLVFTSGGFNLPVLYMIATLVGIGLLVLRLPGERQGRSLLRPRVFYVALILLAVAAWGAFFLSYFDSPVSINRKTWPFYFFGLMVGVMTLIAALPGLNRSVSSDSGSEQGAGEGAPGN